MCLSNIPKSTNEQGSGESLCKRLFGHSRPNTKTVILVRKAQTNTKIVFGKTSHPWMFTVLNVVCEQEVVLCVEGGGTSTGLEVYRLDVIARDYKGREEYKRDVWWSAWKWVQNTLQVTRTLLNLPRLGLVFLLQNISGANDFEHLNQSIIFFHRGCQ